MPRLKSTPHIDKIPSTMTPADLVAWRKGHGFSQEDAANLLGIARRTYLHLERGNTRGGYKLKNIPRRDALAVRGLDSELRILKFRLGRRTLRDDEDGREPIGSGDRADPGHLDAGATEGVAEVTGPHPA